MEAINREILEEKNFLKGEKLSTIYLGGGTPSVLDPKDIILLFKTIRNNYLIDNEAEITLEANPDDLNQEYLSVLKDQGINRLSIGIQSFNDEDLVLMNRRHTARQAINSVEMSKKAGFENFSLDLIYGLPGMNMKKWEKNLDVALDLYPPHLAAYHLSYEPGTVLDYRRMKNRIIPVNESSSFDQYIILTDRMERNGYKHYEISNFALPGKISRHNSAYWTGEKYLGIGPSAHSFDGQSRRWNTSKNSSYIRGIANQRKVYDEESLDVKSRLHDYLMTSLRTSWGADLTYIEKNWGSEYSDHIKQKAGPFIPSGKIIDEQDKLILSKEGMFIADHIIAELFL